MNFASVRWALVGTLCLMAGLAKADDMVGARAHHEAGVSYFDQGRYKEAAYEFMEAYRLSNRSHLLLNVARAHEMADEYAESADAIETLLEREPRHPSRATLRARVTSLRARASDDDGRTPATQPTGAGAGEESDGTVYEPANPDTYEIQDADASPPIGPIVLFSAAGAALVGGVVTGIMAADLSGSLEDRCPGEVCPPDAQSDIDRGSTLALTTDILLASSAALATGGLVWLLLSDDEEEALPVDATAGCTPSGCKLELSGSF